MSQPYFEQVEKLWLELAAAFPAYVEFYSNLKRAPEDLEEAEQSAGNRQSEVLKTSDF